MSAASIAKRGLVVIKPSGVPYDELQPECMVVVDLDGRVVEGELKPVRATRRRTSSCIAPFRTIGGVVHTHSRHATIFAQARREIPCLGTTHADHFHGHVPVTRPLTEQEVDEDYEGHTGRVIVERFAGLDPMAMPARVGCRPRPVCLGRPRSPKSLENAIALEAVAEMALGGWNIEPCRPGVGAVGAGEALSTQARPGSVLRAEID